MDAKCPRCHQMVEDDLHIFGFCPYARLVWQETDFNISTLLHKTTSWLHVFQLIAGELNNSKEKLCKFLMCLWGLWNARNRWIFSGKYMPPKRPVESSFALLSAFQHSRPPTPERRSVDHPSRWLPPAVGWFKLNTDASFHSTGASYAYVLRNHHGRILQSGTGPLVNIHSTEHVEAMAIWWSFSHIRVFWETPLEIATDCLQLSSQLNQQDTNWAVLGGLIDGLRHHLNQCRRWTISYCSRHTNGAAHTLAKLGLSLGSHVNWLYSFHPHVMDMLHSDWLHLNE